MSLTSLACVFRSGALHGYAFDYLIHNSVWAGDIDIEWRAAKSGYAG